VRVNPLPRILRAKNGGVLEKATAVAKHPSTRTTALYDRRRGDLSLDEVERIVF